MRLYNIEGVLVYNNVLKPINGEWIDEVNLSTQIAPGMYTLQLISNYKTQTQKIVIE